MPFDSVIADMWAAQRPAALAVVRDEPDDDALERRFAAAFDPDISDEADEELREAIAVSHVEGARDAARLAGVDWDDETREAAERRGRMAADIAAPALLWQLRDSSAALAAEHVISRRAQGDDVEAQADSLGEYIDGWGEA